MAYVNSTATTFKGGGQALSFKCGSQAALEAYIKGTKTAQDGTFYLTNDTSRLYVGNNGKAVPVNQGVITVATLLELPATGEHGQFYYVTEKNILCVYAGKGLDPETGLPSTTNSGWVQINANTNTEIKSYAKEVTASTNGVVVTDTITDSNNNPFSDSIEFVEGDGIVLTADATNDKITIAAETSALGTKANTANGEIQLTGHDSGSVKFDVTRGSADNKFVSDGSGNVTLHLENKDVKSAEFLNQATGFDLKIHLEDGTPITTSTALDPTITYDGNTAHFVNGNLDLDVYDKGSIDAKFEGINAMHYIGTIGTEGTAGTGVTGITKASSGAASKVSAITNGPSSYKVGDTFLVVNNIGDADTTILAGSLLIAMGTEDATGKITSGLYFEVINESYEQDTTYSFTQTGNKVTLQPSTGGSTGSITIVDDGDSIDVARTGSNGDATFTVSHKAVDVAAGTATKAIVNSTEKFTVVDSIENDGHGHVTKVVTKEVELADFNPLVASESMSTSVNNAKTVGTITHTVSVKATQGAATEAKSSSFELKSDTFEITDSDTTNGNQGLKINMVWGSFE